jgi:hypothetical protein
VKIGQKNEKDEEKEKMFEFLGEKMFIAIYNGDIVYSRLR